MATDPGLALASPFDVDYDGNPRGADGAWDRGAFEFREPRPCDDMGGTCCGPGMSCEGGRYTPSTDCGLRCCLEGACSSATEPSENAEMDGPGETAIDAATDAAPGDPGPDDAGSGENGEGGEGGCGCSVAK
jgi:hypothetical protein